MSGTQFTNPGRPPKCGPLARVRWDEARGRWVRRLTAAGRRRAEAYLARYPRPACGLYGAFPGLARAAFRDHPEEEIQAAARAGVAEAFALYDPASGYAEATYVLWHVRAAVQRELYPRRKAGEPAPVMFLRPDSDPAFADPGQSPWDCLRRPRADDQPDGWGADGWAAVLAPLDARERRLIEWMFLGGLNLREIAAREGVSKERVRQLLARAYDYLRPRLAAGVPGG